MIQDRNILLQVAAEIEADPKYTGAGWWIPQAPCGCAMVRTLKASGAEFYFDSTAVPEYEWDDEKEVWVDTEMGGGEWIDGFKVDGILFAPFEIPQAVSRITGVSDKVWKYFRDFSLHSGRIRTAEVLREIAETGKFAGMEEWA